MAAHRTLALGITLAALGAPRRAHAADPCPATEAQLSAALDRADLHFASGEAARLAEDLAEADAAVRCLSAVLSPAAAAHLHRAHGLALELAGDPAGRQRAFAAAVAADPKFKFSAAILSPRSPAGKGYQEAGRLDRGLQPAPAPAPDVLLFWDGVEGSRRPTAAPTVMQVRWGPTELIFSGLLQPSDPLPGYPQPVTFDELAAESEGALPAVEMPTDQEARRHRITRISLLAGGGGLLVASGGATLAAISNRAEIAQEFFGEDARLEVAGTAGWDSFEADLDAARGRERALVGLAVGAGALGATALTLGVTFTW